MHNTLLCIYMQTCAQFLAEHRSACTQAVASGRHNTIGYTVDTTWAFLADPDLHVEVKKDDHLAA